MFEVWLRFLLSFSGRGTYKHPTVPALFVEDTILSPLNCICTFTKSQLTVFIHVDLILVSLYLFY